MKQCKALKLQTTNQNDQIRVITDVFLHCLSREQEKVDRTQELHQCTSTISNNGEVFQLKYYCDHCEISFCGSCAFHCGHQHPCSTPEQQSFFSCECTCCTDDDKENNQDTKVPNHLQERVQQLLSLKMAGNTEGVKLFQQLFEKDFQVIDKWTSIVDPSITTPVFNDNCLYDSLWEEKKMDYFAHLTSQFPRDMVMKCLETLRDQGTVSDSIINKINIPLSSFEHQMSMDERRKVQPDLDYLSSHWKQRPSNFDEIANKYCFVLYRGQHLRKDIFGTDDERDK